MSYTLDNLKENKVFKYFHELTKIPRCSGNEKAVSDYLVNFAKSLNLDVIQDDFLNVIIKKPGTKGYENSPKVILQGHMDIVCEKNKDTKHDFVTEPLNIRVEEDFIKATGTTLGADNGIAVAYAMALLDSEDISHPPLEILITTEEETGMGGASNINPNHLDGKILINIDSEEEGELLVSCAGGVRAKIAIPLEYNKIDEKISCIIKIRGLKGGHSGMEINKERGNSNKLMGRILNYLNSMDYSLYEINGGSKMNAIPREADAKILINKSELEEFNSKIKEIESEFKNELKSTDKEVKVTLETLNESIDSAFSIETKENIINALMLIPNGIQTMSMDIEGLVQSSTNLGVVTFENDKVILESAVRSSIKSLKYDIVDKMKLLAKLVNGSLITESDYPDWEYNPNSYIRDVFVNTYKDMTGNEPKITAIHAGLECGILKQKLGDIDIISFGPNMYDVHTPEESLSISSAERCWKYLLEVLKNIK